MSDRVDNSGRRGRVFVTQQSAPGGVMPASRNLGAPKTRAKRRHSYDIEDSSLKMIEEEVGTISQALGGMSNIMLSVYCVGTFWQFIMHTDVHMCDDGLPKCVKSECFQQIVCMIWISRVDSQLYSDRTIIKLLQQLTRSTL